MKHFCYKTKNIVIRRAFAAKTETAAVVRRSQNVHQMQSQQNNTCCIPRQKILCLSLQTHEKAAMAYIPSSSFVEFSVQIYRESHSYGKLIMMSHSFPPYAFHTI